MHVDAMKYVFRTYFLMCNNCKYILCAKIPHMFRFLSSKICTSTLGYRLTSFLFAIYYQLFRITEYLFFFFFRLYNFSHWMFWPSQRFLSIYIGPECSPSNYISSWYWRTLRSEVTLDVTREDKRHWSESQQTFYEINLLYISLWITKRHHG